MEKPPKRYRRHQVKRAENCFGPGFVLRKELQQIWFQTVAILQWSCWSKKRGRQCETVCSCCLCREFGFARSSSRAASPECSFNSWLQITERHWTLPMKCLKREGPELWQWAATLVCKTGMNAQKKKSLSSTILKKLAKWVTLVFGRWLKEASWYLQNIAAVRRTDFQHDCKQSQSCWRAPGGHDSLDHFSEQKD